MKITLENTSKMVTLVVDGKNVPARVWQGETDTGVPVQAFITRIAPEIEEDDPRFDEVQREFGLELQRTRDLRPDILSAIPLRMFMD